MRQKLFPLPYNASNFSIMKVFFPASTNVKCDNHMKVGQDEEILQYQNINESIIVNQCVVSNATNTNYVKVNYCFIGCARINIPITLFSCPIKYCMIFQ